MTTSADSPQTPGPAPIDPPAGLAALPVQGEPHILSDGPNALVVRDIPASTANAKSDTGPDSEAPAAAGRVFHLPKHESAAEAHRLRAHLLPYLRGHLTPAVPLPELHTTASTPWGFNAAKWLPGDPFLASRITEHNEDRLAQALAQFLAELHAYPAERAQSLGVPGPREWRATLDPLRRRSVRALRPHLGITERGRLRGWWATFLADDAGAFTPALTHANLEPAHLLLDAEARELRSVLGWTRVLVADASLDIAVVAEHYGADFAWLVLEAYRRHGGRADTGFLAGVRRNAALLPLLDWDHEAAPGESPSAEATARLLERLRSGPVLGSG